MIHRCSAHYLAAYTVLGSVTLNNDDEHPEHHVDCLDNINFDDVAAIEPATCHA